MSSFFSAAEVNPNGDFDVIPPGEYPGIISASEYKATKNNDGHYMNVTAEIIEGPMKGRKVFDIINIDNKSETAHRIAMQTVSAICHATGNDDFVANSADELAGKFSSFHYKPMTLVIQTRSQSGYSDKSGIKQYKPIGADSTAIVHAAPATPGASAAPPWAQKAA